MKEETKIEFSNAINYAITKSISDIPNLVQTNVRKIVIGEICRQLNLIYTCNEFKIDSQYPDKSPFYIEIRDYINSQFKDVIQKDIKEYLGKQDMSKLLKASRSSVIDAIKYAFNNLWREELKIISEREAEKLLVEIKEQLEI